MPSGALVDVAIGQVLFDYNRFLITHIIPLLLAKLLLLSDIEVHYLFGRLEGTSYYRDRDDSDDSQARARNQERFCRDRGGAGRNQTDKQYAVKAERRKTRNVKSVKPRHSPDTSMSELDDDCEQQYAELARVQNGQAPLSLTCDTTVYDTPVFSLYGKVPDDLDPDPDDGSVLPDEDIVPLSVSRLEEKFLDLHEPTSSTPGPREPLCLTWRGLSRGITTYQHTCG